MSLYTPLQPPRAVRTRKTEVHYATPPPSEQQVLSSCCAVVQRAPKSIQHPATSLGLCQILS